MWVCGEPGPGGHAQRWEGGGFTAFREDKRMRSGDAGESWGDYGGHTGSRGAPVPLLLLRHLVLTCLTSCPGEHCEVSARSGRCAPGVCKNGGTCVNLLVGGFKCDCPSGDFEKPFCQVTTRSFPARSFITFRGLRQRFHFTLALS